MISIVDMLKRSEKFSLAFDRSMPIRFQQQFWQLIAFLDKHEITWFNDEPASDHAMCQQLLGQVWRQDCQDVVLSFETQERYLGSGLLVTIIACIFFCLVKIASVTRLETKIVTIE